MTKKFGKIRITLTRHGLERISSRGIPPEKIVGSILQAAEQLDLNSRQKMDVMIENTAGNFSLVVAVSGNNFKIITAIYKTGAYRKQGTDLIAV